MNAGESSLQTKNRSEPLQGENSCRGNSAFENPAQFRKPYRGSKASNLVNSSRTPASTFAL